MKVKWNFYDTKTEMNYIYLTRFCQINLSLLQSLKTVVFAALNICAWTWFASHMLLQSHAMDTLSQLKDNLNLAKKTKKQKGRVLLY